MSATPSALDSARRGVTPELREATREMTGYWSFWLISGILMMILAFWTAGQFFIEKAYVLLVFAGIWALMEGINDIVRAFAIRGLHEEVSGGTATEGSHT